MNNLDINIEQKAKSKDGSLDVLVLLRAIAVMMVCFCHFGEPLKTGHFFSNLFSLFEKYGSYGVYVFFVISGFVIPLSLYRGRYAIESYRRFLVKRVIRLHPPYLAALALTLVIMFLSYKVRHVAFPENGYTIFKSVFYLYYPPDNPVFWTLMVEAQYYIFIGIFYVLMMKYPRLAIILFMPLILIISRTDISNYITFLEYVAFFLVGSVGFFIYIKNGDFYLNCLILAVLHIFIYFIYDVPSFVFSLFTLLMILFFKRNIPASIAFLGLISYSIYLIHFPIGTKFINFLKPKINPEYSWLLFLGATVLCIFLSWIFYLAIELYCERISKRIKYNKPIA